MGPHQPANSVAVATDHPTTKNGFARIYRTIATVGGAITPPRAPIAPDPFALTRTLAKVIRERWAIGGATTFDHLADALIDAMCEHIRTSSFDKLDARVVDAVEDHLHVDPLENDVDAATEASIDDIEAERTKRNTRISMKCSGDSNIRTNAAAMVGSMLKKPEETERYLNLRRTGYDPAGALSVVLSERRASIGAL